MRCTKHGVEFRLPLTCAACTVDPAFDAVDEIGEPITAPEGCRTLEAHERWYTALANQCLAEVAAIDFAAEGERNWHVEGIIAKHREVAIKANRAAAELTSRRTDESLVDARERRIRDRARGGGH